MIEFPQGLDIQTNCIWILVNLMSGKVNIKKIIVEHGGLDQIINAMEHYDMDPHIQLAGSTALAILSKLTAYRQLIPRRGGMQLLLAALRIHRQIVPIQRSVLKAIYRLSFNEQNRTKLGELRIVTEIMESMKVNNQSGPLQRVSILCLLKLTKNPKLKEIIQNKAVPLIVQARNNFSDVPHIHSVASMAVESLVSGTSPATATAAVVPKAKDMVSLRSEVKNLQTKEAEKEGTLSNIHIVIQTLETEVARLKDGIDQEVLNEMIKKVHCKHEIIALKHQKLTLTKELKKIQAEIDEINHTLDVEPLSPKEDYLNDKKNNSSSKKSGLSSSGEIRIEREKEKDKEKDKDKEKKEKKEIPNDSSKKEKDPEKKKRVWALKTP